MRYFLHAFCTHTRRNKEIWIISTFFSGSVRPKQKETALMLLYMFLLSQQGAHEGRSLTAAHLHVPFTTTATEVTELQTEATPKAWRQANSNTQESTHTAELGCLWLHIQASQILRMTKLLMGITWLHLAVLLSVSPGSVWRIQASSASHLQKRRGLLARLLPGHFCTRNSKWIKHQSLKQVRLVGVIVLEGYDDALL